MNYKILSSVLSIVLCIFFIAKNSLDFNPIKFHCDNYTLNSYLYIFLSMAIMISTIFTLEYKDMDIVKLFTGANRFLLLVLSIVLIFSLILI